MDEDLVISDDEDGEDNIIEESPEYSPKSDFNKAKLADDAVRKCLEVRGQEMKSGFWNTKLTKEGIPIKEWKEDTRKSFISTVKALRALLNPEVNRDKKYLVFETGSENKIKDLWENYAYEEWAISIKEDKRVYGGIPVFKKSGRKFMPEINSEVNIQTNPFTNKMSTIRGGWDLQVNAYWDSMLDIYDKIFAALIDLADRNNYFKQQLVYG